MSWAKVKEFFGVMFTTPGDSMRRAFEAYLDLGLPMDEAQEAATDLWLSCKVGGPTLHRPELKAKIDHLLEQRRAERA